VAEWKKKSENKYESHGFEYVDDTLDMRIKMQRSVFVINSNDGIRSSSILWYAHTNLTGKKNLQFSLGMHRLIILSTVITCGYVLVRLADTSMLGIKCSSDKRIID